MENFPKDSETDTREIQRGQENVGSLKLWLEGGGGSSQSPEWIREGICSMLDSGGRHWGSGGGGSQTGVGGGVNGGAEMASVTHSLKRLGSTGGTRPCMAALEKNAGWREGLFLRREIIFKCRWGKEGVG